MMGIRESIEDDTMIKERYRPENESPAKDGENWQRGETPLYINNFHNITISLYISIVYGEGVRYTFV